MSKKSSEATRLHEGFFGGSRSAVVSRAAVGAGTVIVVVAVLEG